MNRTNLQYRIQLEDLTCDVADCGAPAAVIFVYELDDGSSMHSMHCVAHDKPLPRGSRVAPEEVN